MTFDPRHEIGEDYEGVSPRHSQVNEVREFTNDSNTRLFMPDCGPFYKNSLTIKNIADGKPLVQDVDYRCLIMDDVATEKSGKEVCGFIEVLDTNISSVIYDYQFVGGGHSTGYFVLRHLMQMYPDGINAITEWSNILNLPTEFDPSYHTHHVREIFNTEQMLIWLERIRCGVIEFYTENFKSIYDAAQTRIDNLYNKLDTEYVKITNEILAVFNKLKIQGEEYILTDNATNPASERGYGNWVLVKNTILYGAANTFVVGTGTLMALGSEQLIRNTYIWKNVENKTQPSYSLTADKQAINEGDSITFTIKALNTGVSSMALDWEIVGADALDIVGGLATGKVTLTGSNASTVTVTFAKDRRTEGDKTYYFKIRNVADLDVAFVVNDTSVTQTVGLEFRKTNIGAVSSILEDDTVTLAINTVGFNGKTLNLTWSGLTNADFSQPLPTSVAITSNTTLLELKTVGNLKADGDRILKVEARDAADTSYLAASAQVLVKDTSLSLEASISFIVNGLLTTTVNEGNNFNIRINTNGGVGRKLRLEYSSNKQLTEFSGLLEQVTIQTGNVVEITAQHHENNATALVQEYLRVKVFDVNTNIQLDDKILQFKDTSLTPNYVSYFSSDAAGTNEITEVNEGSKFYFIMKVANWVPGADLPTNDFNYLLNGVTQTLPNLQARITNGFYNRLIFGGTNNKTGVTWSGGNQLAIEFTAVADQKVSGDTDFSVQVKPIAVANWEITRSIRINDTSIAAITAQWSSAQNTLVPISSIDEMNSVGENKTAWLWLGTTGDLRGLGDLQLDVSGNIQEDDFVTTFPITTKFTAVNQTLKIPVTVRADFTTEGTESFTLTASYQTNKGLRRNFASAYLTVNDNSNELPLSVALSGTNNDVAGYSEWKPITVTVTSAVLAYATNVTALIQYEDGSDATERFQQIALTGSHPANSSTMNLTLIPKANRKTYSKNNFKITTIRNLSDGTQISTGNTTPFKLKNDSTPPSVVIEAYSDSGRTTQATSLDEGKTYYGRVKITNPNPKTVLAVNNPFASETTKTGTEKFVGRDQNLVIHSTSNKVAKVINPVNDYTVDIYDFSFSLVNDRTTNSNQRWLRLVALADTVNSSLALNVVYPNDDVVGNAGIYRALLDLKINDISKTATLGFQYLNSGGSSVTTLNEGDVMKVRMNYTNATVGDQYYLTLDSTSAVDLTRFEYHDFETRKTATATSGTLEWSFKFLNNRFTNGDKILKIDCMNETGNIKYDLPDFTLVDTSKTPSIDISWGYESALITSVKEVTNNSPYTITVVVDNATSSEQVTLQNIGGRPLTDFASHEFNTSKATTLVSGNRYQAVFNFKMKPNMKDDTVNTINVRATTSSSPTVTKDSSITVLDTSRTRSITKTEWRNSASPNGGSIITSVNEGQAAYLHVYTTGGEDIYGLKLTNNGGRSASRLAQGTYDSIANRTGSDTAAVVWYFSPALDGLTNNGDETRLRVKVEIADDSTKNISAELPINDVSVDTTGVFLTGGGDTVDEGTAYNVAARLDRMAVGVTFRMRATTAHGVDLSGSSANWKSMGSGVYQYDFSTSTYQETFNVTNLPLKISADSKITPSNELSILYELIDVTKNRVLATRTVTINDTSKPNPEYSIKLVATNNANAPAISSMKEGETAYIVVTTKYFTGQLNIAYSGQISTNANTPLVPPDMTATRYFDITEYNGQSVVLPFRTQKDESWNNGGSSTIVLKNSNFNSLASVGFTIVENSIPASFGSVYWASDAAGVNVLSNQTCSEGDTVYLIAKTVGMEPGVPINVSWGGSTTNADDFSEGSTASPVALYVTNYNANDFTGMVVYKMTLKNDLRLG